MTGFRPFPPSSFSSSSASTFGQGVSHTLLKIASRRYANTTHNCPALSPSFVSRHYWFPSAARINSTRQDKKIPRRLGFQDCDHCAPPSSTQLVSAFIRRRHTRCSSNLETAAATTLGIHHGFQGLNCSASFHGTLAAIPDVSFIENTTRDFGVMFLALILALAWVRVFDELARNNLLEQKLSRKLVHITSGLLFMLSWPFFSPAPSARAFAAIVPALNLLRLLALGMGWAKDEAAVRAISRGGQRSELLRGPLYYVIALTAITLTFWSTSPVGAIALALMCGGDGFADIVGRRVGSAKLPWNPQKSWAGSAAMFGCGSLIALGFTAYFASFGSPIDSWSDVGVKVVIIALVSTIVESLPITDKLDDNLTVPLSAVIVGCLLFPSSPL